MRLEYYINEGANNTLVDPPEVAKRISHINASPEFLNDSDKMNILYGMCEVADRKTRNKSILEIHYGIVN